VSKAVGNCVDGLAVHGINYYMTEEIGLLEWAIRSSGPIDIRWIKHKMSYPQPRVILDMISKVLLT